ncbi:NAD-dependent epimerase/dehydratase family protein [Rheinheimera sp. 1928-s]|uniref:NAD-dependent epimerase/dehydratase family protein n=1 Tax=Rheinheimera sp. 1928-s TaxID=3033803 RepID=UPI00262EC0C0|nr:NAD-dependent epimerase/dehydratase family protein [Rheinheimera sp. 1928-s]MDF3125308.1 NAD-dependent epimerase/dehydratase family protein [Rheinheimera sp. 1928-s]
MKLFILGLGHVGKALAKKLKADGHQVVGSTTTAAKVAGLEPLVDEVVLLKGEETAKVAAAAAGCDAIIVTVAPNVRNTRTKEEREVHYEQVLVRSCQSAAMACPRVIFLSSFSVYGDGGAGTDAIDELTPTANHQEPSSKYYQLAEQQVLTSTLGCVLRFPDMYGAPGDFSFPQRVKMAIDYFGGKAIFSADAPLYAIHFEDVVAAVHHVIQARLAGIFNVCDNDQLPATNKAVFDAICDQNDWPRLEFLNQIKAPLRKISAAKIYATGYQVKHPDPNAPIVASVPA